MTQLVSPGSHLFGEVGVREAQVTGAELGGTLLSCEGGGLSLLLACHPCTGSHWGLLCCWV